MFYILLRMIRENERDGLSGQGGKGNKGVVVVMEAEAMWLARGTEEGVALPRARAERCSRATQGRHWRRAEVGT